MENVTTMEATQESKNMALHPTCPMPGVKP